MQRNNGVFRWGILGTGFVASRFALGLRTINNATVAAVGSRRESTAREFARQTGAENAYGSAEELVADDSLDAIYIATPPSVHREHALLCAARGRPVLLEKPFATSAIEAEEVVREFESRSLFCMEAMWTRFLPLTVKLRQILASGEIGEPSLITGSFCAAESRENSAHLFNPGLGGGVVLDRAVYPISLTCHLLGMPDRVSAQLTTGPTRVDEQAAITFGYTNGCLAQFQASLTTNSRNDFTIMGTHGIIEVAAPIYRPFSMRIRTVRPRVRGPNVISRSTRIKESHFVQSTYQRLAGLVGIAGNLRSRNIRLPYSGNGYGHQALEVMHCLQHGRTESAVMPLRETIDIMRLLDQIRAGSAHEYSREPGTDSSGLQGDPA